MINRIYDKVGSFSKNGSLLTRSIGYKFREIVKSSSLKNRRNSVNDIFLNKASFDIDNDKGYHVIDGLESLDYTKDVISISKSEFSKLDKDSIDWKSKSHLFTGVLEDYEIDEDSPIIKFALQSKLIAPITKYFGFIPLLSYVGTWYSPGKATEHTSSQLFHCDQADIRQVKVFVHCSDITNEDGALNLIDAHKSQDIRNKINYSWRPDSQMLSDIEVEKYVQKTNWVAQEGKEGTVAFADTSRCFHFGSRLNENSKERLMMVFQFLSPCAFNLPANISSKIPFSKLDPSRFNKVERQILGIET